MKCIIDFPDELVNCLASHRLTVTTTKRARRKVEWEVVAILRDYHNMETKSATQFVYIYAD